MYRFARSFAANSPVLHSRNGLPLDDDQIRSVAPSIFAEEAHTSRSERYAYIPTATVLQNLRTEGFQPFMVAQTRVRKEDRRDFTKHMIRLRHVSSAGDSESVPEILLLNSHDGSSSYQMLAGTFRFVCTNGLVAGEVLDDIRIPHKGNVVDSVLQGAHDVLDGFDLVREVRDDMRGIALSESDAQAFAHAAIEYRYEPTEARPAPITPAQLLHTRRAADTATDLWTTLNKVQENSMRGGLSARMANGRRTTTRAVGGIDQGVKLNRALWVLAEHLRQAKTTTAVTA